MVASGHWAVIRFTFDDVDNAIEEVRSTMLAVECPRHHGVDGSEVGFALGAPIYAFARQISTVAHAHCV